MLSLPARPSSILDVFGQTLQVRMQGDLAEMQQELSELDTRRESIYRLTKQVFKNVAKVGFLTRVGSTESTEV